MSKVRFMLLNFVRSSLQPMTRFACTTIHFLCGRHSSAKCIYTSFPQEMWFIAVHDIYVCMYILRFGSLITLIYILHFTLVSIVTGGYFFPWLYWQEVVVSYTTGNCKMMFPISYLVCLLIVYYLVQQDQLDWRKKYALVWDLWFILVLGVGWL